MAHDSALGYSPTELKILIHKNLNIKTLFETDQKKNRNNPDGQLMNWKKKKKFESNVAQPDHGILCDNKKGQNTNTCCH